MARIAKNSTLERATGGYFAILYKNSKKMAILLKIGARGWGIWEKVMVKEWEIW